jgi:ketosteroid isomerase-like protein
VTTRNQQIAVLLERHNALPSLDQHVLNVRTFGDLVVVIGSYDEQLHAGGKPVSRRGMFTHVYKNAHGHWLCINAHRTAAAESEHQKIPGVEE